MDKSGPPLDNEEVTVWRTTKHLRNSIWVISPAYRKIMQPEWRFFCPRVSKFAYFIIELKDRFKADLYGTHIAWKIEQWWRVYCPLNGRHQIDLPTSMQVHMFLQILWKCRFMNFLYWFKVALFFQQLKLLLWCLNTTKTTTIRSWLKSNLIRFF